jgi:hypothetical protein
MINHPGPKGKGKFLFQRSINPMVNFLLTLAKIRTYLRPLVFLKILLLYYRNNQHCPVRNLHAGGKKNCNRSVPLLRGGKLF